MNLANFTLAKTSLIRLGCPRELEGQLANRAVGRPIIAVANKNEYGRTASDYCPAVVVICGAETRRQLLAQGHTKSWAFLERGAVEVDANDSMPYDELMARLSGSLQDKYYSGLPGQARPQVTRIYPFENRVEFKLRENNMQHQYALDTGTRHPMMLGQAISAEAASPLTIRYVHPSPARTELITHILMNTPNVLKAVAQYLALTKGARSIKPDFSPCAATFDKKINAMLQAKGVDAFEFALWLSAKNRGVQATVEQLSYMRSSAKCPSCGTKVVGDLNTCSKCGTKISAGGPGSGRRPGFGTGISYDSVAKHYGYTPQSTLTAYPGHRPDRVYSHPSGHSFSAPQQGEGENTGWTHSRQYKSSDGRTDRAFTYGSGPKALAKHLAGIHG